MGELIKIQREEVRPRVVCGNCKGEVLMDLSPFNNDCTKIMKDKCPKCKRDIYVGLLIVSHPQQYGLMQCIKLVMEALDKGNQIIGGEKQ